MKQKKMKGFTLVEVIISLAILALLIVPTLSIYAALTQENTRAQIDQKAVNLSQNLMESFKTRSMEELCRRFNGVEGFDLLNSNLNGFSGGYLMKAYADQGYGEYSSITGNPVRINPGDTKSSLKLSGVPATYLFSPPTGQAEFLFGVELISDGEASYDALIKMDASTYRDSVKYPDSMNNYRMPGLQELLQGEVTLLDPEGITATWSDSSVTGTCDNSASTDLQAQADFMNIQSAYLIFLEEEDSEETPVPYTVDEIKAAIQKSIIVNVIKTDTEHVRIECKVSYSCNLDLNGDGVQENACYDLYSQKAPITHIDGLDREIYLFYTPSTFTNQDIISVSNDGAKIKFFITRQQGTSGNGVRIQKSVRNSAETIINTNLTVSELDASSVAMISQHSLITKEDASDRIYDIKIEIYQAGSIATGALTDPITELTSVWEAED